MNSIEDKLKDAERENVRLRQEVELLRKIVSLYEKLDENKNFPRPMSVDIKKDVFGHTEELPSVARPWAIKAKPMTCSTSIFDVYFK